MLRLAIQSKGRLNEESTALLREIGIDVDDSRRKFLAQAANFPLELLYMRDDDIPQVVSNGTASLGIVGLNEVAERGFDVQVVEKLGFGACRISLAVPKTVDYDGPQWFNGKRWSEAVLISSGKLTEEEQKTLEEMLFRFESAKVSRHKKYILMNLPQASVEEATRILPAMRSPTVMPLAAEGWCSMHSVVDEADLWEKIQQLKAIGAEGILVLNIDKIIP